MAMSVKSMSNLRFKKSKIVIIILILIALAVRVYLAPRSAGSDITQFYGFGGTMLHHGVDFYNYATTSHWKQEGWPYPWPYNYGPVFAYLLGLLRALHLGTVEYFWDTSGYHVYVSSPWIVAVKAFCIAADVGIAVLLYRMGSRRALGIMAAAFYLFNPMVIYVSSIYGMFDGLAILSLIFGLYLMKRGRNGLGYGLIGFSLAVKQTMLFPVLAVLWDSVLKRGRGTGSAIGYMTIGFVLPFLPLLPSAMHIGSMFHLMRGMKPGYTYPVVYNLNGIVALMSYVHMKVGIDTLFYMRHWWIFGVLSLMTVLFIHYRLRNLSLSLVLAYAAFLATYWRVNTQYTLPFIALVALLIACSDSIWDRATAIAATVPVTLWPLLFPTSFWFHVHIEHPDWHAVHLINRVTKMVFNTWPFVELSMTFTFLLLVFLMWGVFKATRGNV